MCKALGWVGVGVKPIRACLCLWSQRPSLLWCSPAGAVLERRPPTEGPAKKTFKPKRQVGVGSAWTMPTTIRFLFLWLRGLLIISFSCHCARTRAGVALSQVGLSPASATAMVRGEKASPFCSALRVGDQTPSSCSFMLGRER